MLPKDVDPLFPNKHPAGHDVFGRPFYDMAATGLTGYTIFLPPIADNILHNPNATAVPMGDMIPKWHNGRWYNCWAEYMQAGGKEVWG